MNAKEQRRGTLMWDRRNRLIITLREEGYNPSEAATILASALVEVSLHHLHVTVPEMHKALDKQIVEEARINKEIGLHQ